MKPLTRFRARCEQAANHEAKRQARTELYAALLKRHRIAVVLKHAHQVGAVLDRAELDAAAPLFAGART